MSDLNGEINLIKYLPMKWNVCLANTSKDEYVMDYWKSLKGSEDSKVLN